MHRTRNTSAAKKRSRRPAGAALCKGPHPRTREPVSVFLFPAVPLLDQRHTSPQICFVCVYRGGNGSWLRVTFTREGGRDLFRTQVPCCCPHAFSRAVPYGVGGLGDGVGSRSACSLSLSHGAEPVAFICFKALRWFRHSIRFSKVRSGSASGTTALRSPSLSL